MSRTPSDGPEGQPDETQVLRADQARAIPSQGVPADGGPTGRAADPPAGQPYAPTSTRRTPERRRTWQVPAIIGFAIVAVVGAVVLLLTLGAGEERAAGRTGQGVTSPVGSGTESATGPASATPDGSATEVAGEAAAGEAAAGEDGREVSADPLEPRMDKEIIGTDFALGDAGWTEDAAGTRAGASEAVAGTYTDGATDVAVTAAAFGTIAEQDAYSEQLAGDLEDDGAQLLSEGSVYPDSTGRHWAYMLADAETTTVVWRTDDGVVLTLSGDAEAVAEVYSGMLI